MSFLHVHDIHRAAKADDCVFVFDGNMVLVSDNDGCGTRLPRFADIGAVPERAFFIGTLNYDAVWMFDGAPKDIPAGFSWRDGRALAAVVDADMMRAYGCAFELAHWLRRGKFCGVCGAQTEVSESECVIRCPKCGALFYPTPAAAVIVAVTRGDRLLLAHNRNFPNGRYSVIAGFVDPGESLEDAAAREIREEVGLEIRNLRYVKSQPWPFPNSLMAAFIAESPDGEIRCDGKEIVEAGWFHRGELPDIPAKGSIARELIESWAESLQ